MNSLYMLNLDMIFCLFHTFNLNCIYFNKNDDSNMWDVTYLNNKFDKSIKELVNQLTNDDLMQLRINLINSSYKIINKLQDNFVGIINDSNFKQFKFIISNNFIVIRKL